jgi:hypothetical protein
VDHFQGFPRLFGPNCRSLPTWWRLLLNLCSF